MNEDAILMFSVILKIAFLVSLIVFFIALWWKLGSQRARLLKMRREEENRTRLRR